MGADSDGGAGEIGGLDGYFYRSINHRSHVERGNDEYLG